MMGEQEIRTCPGAGMAPAARAMTPEEGYHLTEDLAENVAVISGDGACCACRIGGDQTADSDGEPWDDHSMPRRTMDLSTFLTPYRVAAAVLTVLAAVFVLQNRDSTVITLLWAEVRAPLWFILAILFIVGWLVGALMFRDRRKRRERVSG